MIPVWPPWEHCVCTMIPVTYNVRPMRTLCAPWYLCEPYENPVWAHWSHVSPMRTPCVSPLEPCENHETCVSPTRALCASHMSPVCDPIGAMCEPHKSCVINWSYVSLIWVPWALCEPHDYPVCKPMTALCLSPMCKPHGSPAWSPWVMCESCKSPVDRYTLCLIRFSDFCPYKYTFLLSYTLGICEVSNGILSHMIIQHVQMQ